jgi:DNA-binding response OmpR family regulator
MGGTVLFVNSRESTSLFADHFRTNGLLVYEAERAEDAVQQVDGIAPDVVVAVLGQDNGPSVIRELRSSVDYATSIIVIADLNDREEAQHAGADSLLLKSALPSEVLYEVRRALILRRSGRRLPWNPWAVSRGAWW